jgi:hypothetical protein
MITRLSPANAPLCPMLPHLTMHGATELHYRRLDHDPVLGCHVTIVVLIHRTCVPCRLPWSWEDFARVVRAAGKIVVVDDLDGGRQHRHKCMQRLLGNSPDTSRVFSSIPFPFYLARHLPCRRAGLAKTCLNP